MGWPLDEEWSVWRLLCPLDETSWLLWSKTPGKGPGSAPELTAPSPAQVQVSVLFRRTECFHSVLLLHVHFFWAAEFFMKQIVSIKFCSWIGYGRQFSNILHLSFSSPYMSYRVQVKSPLNWKRLSYDLRVSHPATSILSWLVNSHFSFQKPLNSLIMLTYQIFSSRAGFPKSASF